MRLADQVLDRAQLGLRVGRVLLGVDLEVVALDEERAAPALLDGRGRHDGHVLGRALVGVADLGARDLADDARRPSARAPRRRGRARVSKAIARMLIAGTVKPATSPRPRARYRSWIEAGRTPSWRAEPRRSASARCRARRHRRRRRRRGSAGQCPAARSASASRSSHGAGIARREPSRAAPRRSARTGARCRSASSSPCMDSVSAMISISPLDGDRVGVSDRAAPARQWWEDVRRAGRKQAAAHPQAGGVGARAHRNDLCVGARVRRPGPVGRDVPRQMSVPSQRRNNGSTDRSCGVLQGR